MSESESTRKNFPDWENLYKSQSVETMPWYNERFDFDLERELDQRKIIANGPWYRSCNPSYMASQERL
jgi:hypothetical protein